MIFTFPDNVAIVGNTIKNFGPQPNSFNPIDPLNPINNLISIGGTDYFYRYLNNGLGNKGGNSIILELYDSQDFDQDALEYGEPDLILKVSRQKSLSIQKKSYMRFNNEIRALKACNDKSFQNIITIYHSGICKIRNSRMHGYDEHQFYTMEYASFDLKSYIEHNHYRLDLNDKIRLCLSLCEGLNELFSLGYYHRDIKPDNIFMIGDEWKIGDLGLMSMRDIDCEVDKIGEFIGPRGWISPEAMNKYLCEGKDFNLHHNCKIDHQSDIFQLGKVFWYIFQYNAPIGSIKERDFLVKDSQIYGILKTMVSYSKEKRYKSIDEIISLLKRCEERIRKQTAA